MHPQWQKYSLLNIDISINRVMVCHFWNEKKIWLCFWNSWVLSSISAADLLTNLNVLYTSRKQNKYCYCGQCPPMSTHVYHCPYLLFHFIHCITCDTHRQSVNSKWDFVTFFFSQCQNIGRICRTLLLITCPTWQYAYASVSHPFSVSFVSTHDLTSMHLGGNVRLASAKRVFTMQILSHFCIYFQIN